MGRRDGDVIQIPRMRTQPVAAKAVGEVLAAVATGEREVFELGGPREESMVALAELVAGKRGNGLRIEAVDDEHGLRGRRMLPEKARCFAGPTFEERTSR